VRACYADFVAKGMGQPSVLEGLHQQVFLGIETFTQRFPLPASRWKDSARLLARNTSRSPSHFLTGVYTMREIADHCRVY
jgi:hypothetical protein